MTSSASGSTNCSMYFISFGFYYSTKACPIFNDLLEQEGWRVKEEPCIHFISDIIFIRIVVIIFNYSKSENALNHDFLQWENQSSCSFYILIIIQQTDLKLSPDL